MFAKPYTANFAALSAAVCVCVLAGCDDGATSEPGSLEFLLEAEDTVREGLEPGEGVEDLRDGWSVRWQNYLITIGHVQIVSAVDSTRSLDAEDRFVADLTKVPTAGLPLWSFDELEPTRWNVFYEVGEPVHGAMRDASVEPDDFEMVVAGDLSYLIRGTLAQTGGQSCPPSAKAEVGDSVPKGDQNARQDPCYDNPSIEFELSAQAGAAFGPCEIDELPGVAVPSGGSQSAALTIHGDHVFFNGFPQGDEGGISRRAQWLADADLNIDGRVTREELQSLSASDMAAFDEGYQFGAAPEGALDSLWTYVAAQLRTQGHFQGEGECPIDGVGHDH